MPRADLSRFADDIWVMDHAQTDAHWVGRCLHWAKFPHRFKRPVKAFALAVLDHLRPAVLTLGPPGDSASFETLRGWTDNLLVFTKWLITQRVRLLCDVTEDDLDRYRIHVLDLARSPGRRAQLLHAVRVLWAYRDHLPASCRIAGPRPWGAASSLELADAVVKTRHNRTPHLPPETMEALLGWSLRLVEDFAPDILSALTEHRRLMNGTHALPSSSARGRGNPIADRGAAYVRQLAASGRSLPGKTDKCGDVVLDVAHLARLLGTNHHRVRRVQADILRVAGDLGVPIASDAHLGSITGLLHGVPWRSEPIGVRELWQLVTHLATACFIVIAYLSGMRPGEALGLRRGCVTTEGEVLSVHGRPSKRAGHKPDELEATTRSWTVVSPVAAAINVLEELADYPLLFPSARWQVTRRVREERAATTAEVNKHMRAFVDWVNATFHQPGGGPVIPPDPSGRNLHASRFRRIVSA